MFIRFLKIMVLVSALTSLYACAMVDSATRELMPEDKPSAPRVYYAGVENLKMYPESGFSGAPIAELPLHEKVLRYKLEKGFAYVKVPRTGQTGWVRNKDLVWRTSTRSKKSEETVSPPPKEQQIESPSERTPEVNHFPNQEIERRDASMFDAL